MKALCSRRGFLRLAALASLACLGCGCRKQEDLSQPSPYLDSTETDCITLAPSGYAVPQGFMDLCAACFEREGSYTVLDAEGKDITSVIDADFRALYDRRPRDWDALWALFAGQAAGVVMPSASYEDWYDARFFTTCEGTLKNGEDFQALCVGSGHYKCRDGQVLRTAENFSLEILCPSVPFIEAQRTSGFTAQQADFEVTLSFFSASAAAGAAEGSTVTTRTTSGDADHTVVFSFSAPAF